MADITDQHDQTAPNELDQSHTVSNGTAPANENRGVKRQRTNDDDDDDEGEKGGRERRKIEIKFIADKSRRHITFSKRKAGIMKKVSPKPFERCALSSGTIALRCRRVLRVSCGCGWFSTMRTDC